MRAHPLLRWLAALSGLAVGFAIAVWLVLLISLRSSAAKVPNVRGMDLGYATTAVQADGLVPRIQDGVFDPQVEVGRVAQQRPPAGFELKRGASVLIYPSLGRSVQRVGDLTNLPVSLAEAELEAEKLPVDRRCEVDGQADGIVVTAQMPAAGTLVGPGTPVTLLVNRSPRERRYVMPDFVSTREEDATRVLRALGFQLAAVQRVAYPGVVQATVLRQDPPAGGPVAHGAVIGLWVSR
jgi:serine/threonine-protein kinase